MCMMGDIKSREREQDNLKEACEFYRKAVEKGHAGAEIRWYRAAAKLGRASGCDALRRLGVALTDEA